MADEQRESERQRENQEDREAKQKRRTRGREAKGGRAGIPRTALYLDGVKADRLMHGEGGGRGGNCPCIFYTNVYACPQGERGEERGDERQGMEE